MTAGDFKRGGNGEIVFKRSELSSAPIFKCKAGALQLLKNQIFLW